MDKPANDSTPLLDLIRHEEAQVTKRLAAAREKAAQEIAQARQQAEAIVAQGEEKGRRQGRAERQAVLDEAMREAEEIVAQAHARAEALKHITPEQMKTAVAQAVAIVLGEGAFAQRES